MEETEAVKHIVKVKDMMETGLLLLYTKDRIDRVKKRSTNIDRFRKQFGINPITACNLYEDMQLADLETEWVPGPTSLRFFLMGLYLLRKYPTYDDIESTFDYGNSSKYKGSELYMARKPPVPGSKSKRLFSKSSRACF